MLTDEELRQKFLKYDQICTDINHPNVISIRRTGELEYNGKKYRWSIQDYFHPNSLSFQEIPKNTLLSQPFQKRLDLISQLLEGIIAIRSRYYIHNDLHPGNILISRETNTIKIIDPGFSRQEPGREDTDFKNFNKIIEEFLLTKKEKSRYNDLTNCHIFTEFQEKLAKIIANSVEIPLEVKISGSPSHSEIIQTIENRLLANNMTNPPILTLFFFPLSPIQIKNKQDLPQLTLYNWNVKPDGFYFYFDTVGNSPLETRKIKWIQLFISREGIMALSLITNRANIKAIDHNHIKEILTTIIEPYWEINNIFEAVFQKNEVKLVCHIINAEKSYLSSAIYSIWNSWPEEDKIFNYIKNSLIEDSAFDIYDSIISYPYLSDELLNILLDTIKELYNMPNTFDSVRKSINKLPESILDLLGKNAEDIKKDRYTMKFFLVNGIVLSVDFLLSFPN